MAKTVIVDNRARRDDDADSTALWVILLVAFAVVLIAIVGFGRNDGPAPEPRSVMDQAVH